MTGSGRHCVNFDEYRVLLPAVAGAAGHRRIMRMDQRNLWKKEILT
jgi:hypothetical protein